MNDTVWQNEKETDMTCLFLLTGRTKSTRPSKLVNLPNAWATNSRQKTQGFQKFWADAVMIMH